MFFSVIQKKTFVNNLCIQNLLGLLPFIVSGFSTSIIAYDVVKVLEFTDKKILKATLVNIFCPTKQLVYLSICY